MFDLDRLAAFDRAFRPAPGRRDASPCPPAPEADASGAQRTVCTMVSRLGVEPLCPFARTEAA